MKVLRGETLQRAAQQFVKQEKVEVQNSRKHQDTKLPRTFVN